MRSAFLFLFIIVIVIVLAPVEGKAQTSPPAVPAPITPTASAVPAPPKPPSGAGPGLVVVVLDPAHGGSDSGARGSTGAAESEIVLDLMRAIRVALEARGLRVLLTREGNQNPSFDDRSTLINGLHEAVFLSLHISSTGPPGTVRAYTSLIPSTAAQPSAPAVSRTNQVYRPNLLQWDRAQVPYLSSSRQLAELLQIQLAQKFKGSPDIPSEAAVRQLRTIAAPAVAIEISSVAAADAKRLAQMGQPLADAVARAIVDYRQAISGSSAAPIPGGAH